jgi:hypothetical protein
MDKVSLLNVNNAMVDVNVVRFFSLNNNKYLIYSMNEIDEQNYVKLYAVKISDNGNFVSSNIVDENEWNAVKEMIKTIIKENKEGNLNIEDLDYSKLANMQLSESRIFKLSMQLTELLQANKKTFETTPEVSTDNIMNVAPNVEQPTEMPAFEEPAFTQQQPVVENQMPDVDYQAMYLAEKANNDKLNQELSELKNKIEAIKNML